MKFPVNPLDGNAVFALCFCLLLVFTHCILFVFGAGGYAVFGVVCVCWAVLVAVRILWAAEIRPPVHTQSAPSLSAPLAQRPPLPAQILIQRQTQSEAQQARRVARAWDRLFALMMLCGAVAALWTLYVFVSPAPFAGEAPWLNRCAATVAALTGYALVGLSLWCARSIAMLSRSSFFTAGCAVIFAAGVLWSYTRGGIADGTISGFMAKGLGFGHGLLLLDAGIVIGAPSSLTLRFAESGVVGVVFMLLPALVLVWRLLNAGWVQPAARLTAWGAVGVLVILHVVDVWLPASVGLWAVILSGWALVGALWASVPPVEHRRKRPCPK